MPDKLLDLKNDLVFQRLFGNPKNKEVTRHLLHLILKREIRNIDLDANKIFLGSDETSKTGRLDVRVKFNDGEDCNIEMQVRRFENMEGRMLEYWANMYGNKIHSGEEYRMLKPSISILIANYNVDKAEGIPNYHSKWNLREEEYKDFKLTNDMEFHILELPKVKKANIENDELAQWLRFISNPEDEEVHRIMCENKFYKQAREELAYLSGNKDFKRVVDARAGFLRDQEAAKTVSFAEGEAIGEARGRAEGEAEKSKEIAKKMKAKNMPIEEIVELTGLTKEEIEKL